MIVRYSTPSSINICMGSLRSVRPGYGQLVLSFFFYKQICLLQIHIYIYIYIYKQTYIMHTCMYLYICMCVCVCVCVCVCIYTYI